MPDTRQWQRQPEQKVVYCLFLPCHIVFNIVISRLYFEGSALAIPASFKRLVPNCGSTSQSIVTASCSFLFSSSTLVCGLACPIARGGTAGVNIPVTVFPIPSINPNNFAASACCTCGT